ncbi:MAG: thiamine-phosphate kinase [Bauldia sp.]|nr:thiamine-phosphate kinase [Bauldia sp.]
MAGDRTRPGEFALIDRHFRPLAGEGAFGLADDAALVAPRPGEEIVVTKDMIVEGVHFFPDDPPAAIAAKALRVNLSDLAAKGAGPFGYFLGLGLRDGWTEDWVAAFAAGLAADQRTFGVALLGGDTTRAGERTIVSITALGRLPAGTMVHRSGARPGDVVMVTGTIGDAALALHQQKAGRLAPVALHRRFLYPEPRVALAPLVRRFAHAAMDVSDGLVGDLGHLCRASGVTVEIDAAAVPLSPDAAALIDAEPALLATALTGGDDYELLMAIAPADADACAAAGTTVTPIGRIVAGEGPPTIRGHDGQPLHFQRSGFDHFA